jgi:hypothetical protein
MGTAHVELHEAGVAGVPGLPGMQATLEGAREHAQTGHTAYAQLAVDVVQRPPLASQCALCSTSLVP